MSQSMIRPVRALLLLALLGATPAWPAADPASPEGESAKFSPQQLDDMVAAIALWPDNMLAQVFIASTYPLEIVTAARWQKKNPNLKGDELQKTLDGEDWDASVKWLVNFPDVLQRMSDDLDWTKDLGDAFLEQQKDVMDAVQRMRERAYSAGNLKTTPQQTVVKEKEVIKIEPAQQDVVYVPQYQPAVYGSSYAPPPAYQPSWWATPGGMVTTSLLSFGAGMAVGGAIWGWGNNDCDWHGGNVYNNNYYNNGNGGGNNNNVNINKEKTTNRNRETNRGDRGSNRGGRNTWQHNPSRREGVPYRDKKTSDRFGGEGGRGNQDLARGRGDGRGQGGGGRASTMPANRSGAGGPGGSRAGGPGGSRPGGAGGGGMASNRPATPQTRPGGGGGGRSDAFGGYGNGRQARDASARGAASRGGTSWAGGGGRGGGGGGGFGGGGRGGGGGGRGGGGRGGGGRGGRR